MWVGCCLLKDFFLGQTRQVSWFLSGWYPVHSWGVWRWAEKDQYWDGAHHGSCHLVFGWANHRTWCQHCQCCPAAIEKVMALKTASHPQHSTLLHFSCIRLELQFQWANREFRHVIIYQWSKDANGVGKKLYKLSLSKISPRFFSYTDTINMT